MTYETEQQHTLYLKVLIALSDRDMKYLSNFNCFYRAESKARQRFVRHIEANPELPLAQAILLEIVKRRLKGMT